jgi:hypothetical protein
MQESRKTQLGTSLSIVLLKIQLALIKTSKFNHFNKVGKDGGEKLHYLIPIFKEKSSILIWT